eukprot:1376432-Prymnesium_polylepis.1
MGGDSMGDPWRGPRRKVGGGERVEVRTAGTRTDRAAAEGRQRCICMRAHVCNGNLGAVGACCAVWAQRGSQCGCLGFRVSGKVYGSAYADFSSRLSRTLIYDSGDFQTAIDTAYESAFI